MDQNRNGNSRTMDAGIDVIAKRFIARRIAMTDFPQYFDRFLHIGYYGGSLPYRCWIRSRLMAERSLPILVLFYHRIADDGCRLGTHSNRLFRQQIGWLQQRCNLVSLEEAQRRLRSGRNDRLAACITFDDGYSENCDEALPFLIDQQIPCTYFVSSSHVLEGRRFAHDVAVDLHALPNTLEQIRWMSQAGIEIGAHTRTHADLGQITDESKLHDEVVGAAEELQAAIGKPIRYFAFPFGMPNNLNARAFQMARDFGYEAVCSAYGDYNFPGDDCFHLRRVHVDDMLQLKNWATVNPRRLRAAHSFSYSLAGDATLPASMAQSLT
jgi:peptidoglycan/xylan/chitin deacetylase (PgdA/CDA1 family)